MMEQVKSEKEKVKSVGFDFSFSGVKTAVLYTLRDNEEKMSDEKFRRDIAASFQEAVVDVLVKKSGKGGREVSACVRSACGWRCGKRCVTDAVARNG